jgi:hypothetical protein
MNLAFRESKPGRLFAAGKCSRPGGIRTFMKLISPVFTSVQRNYKIKMKFDSSAEQMSRLISGETACRFLKTYG